MQSANYQPHLACHSSLEQRCWDTYGLSVIVALVMGGIRDVTSLVRNDDAGTRGSYSAFC